MSTASCASIALANLRGAETCTDIPETCTDIPETCTVSSVQIAITNLIRTKNPSKTWAFVADLFGLKERSAKHRLANSRAYTIEELQLLLQGDFGAECLEALMADAKPVWWTDLQKTLKLSAARALQEEAQQLVLSIDAGPMDRSQRRKTTRFFDADKKLSAARAKEETAVGFLHQNHSRPVDRAVAQAKASRR